MRILTIFIALLTLSFAPAAHAQFGEPGDFGGILEGILGKGGQLPGENPAETASLIDNIPVDVSIESEMTLDGKLLVVSAYAAPPASGGVATPQLLGETRILMTGLTPSLQIIVAAPGQVTEAIDYARIEAKVLDENGNSVLKSKEDGFFRGDTPAAITLAPLDYVPPPDAPPPVIGLETAKGQVALADKAGMFRGSTLMVQLVETGLAGARTKVIAGETVVDLDQKTAPFDFTLDRGVRNGTDEPPLAFDAWINDWAGRKTHVMSSLVPYNGPDRQYRLTLDSFKTGGIPGTSEIMSPLANPHKIITGEAQFDAFKGLPAGSRMTVSLNRAVSAYGAAKELTSKTFLLDGLSGNVKFDLVADSKDFDPLIPPPVIRIRITDANNRLFFTSNDVQASDGANLVRLKPSSLY